MMEKSNFNNIFQQYVYINAKNILFTEIFIEDTLNDKRLLGTYAAFLCLFCLWSSAIYLNSLLNKGLLRSSLLRISSDHWRGHIMGHQTPWQRFCTPWCSVAWRLPTLDRGTIVPYLVSNCTESIRIDFVFYSMPLLVALS